MIRRVWLGDPKSELVTEQRQRYKCYNADQSFVQDQTITTTDPREMIERLVETTRRVGADSLNLRVHLPGITADEARDQIVRLPSDVLPELRKLLSDL